MLIVFCLVCFLPLYAWGAPPSRSGGPPGSPRAALANSNPDISSLLVLDISDVEAAAAAAALFEDDIEDTLPHDLDMYENHADSIPGAPSQLPESDIPTSSISGGAQLPSQAAETAKDTGAADSTAARLPAASVSSDAARGPPPPAYPTSSLPTAAKGAAAGGGGGIAASGAAGGVAAGAAAATEGGPLGRHRGSLRLLSFTDAHKHFCAALRSPSIPWRYRWITGRLGNTLKRPNDELLSAFQAALLQAGTHGIYCLTELRRLRSIDKGKTKPRPDELPYLKTKIITCIAPIKEVADLARQQLGPQLINRGPQSGGDRAAAFLVYLSEAATATERNFVDLIDFYQALFDKAPRHVVDHLRQRRDAAKSEYENAKRRMRTEAKYLEERKMVPVFMPLF
ncbi:hypothetical protein, conserved [Eimeria acervulina]|uniref:Uncharacterized protein n=1 Tax=Eimeria acervulina TaxID=5801 RepID=U6GB33_EIMAC|nr:hypothetical protein, conserved [Eimeria acervulina]CDI77350.1 hypothetical protein, conserved [Eimeria acervulina]